MLDANGIRRLIRRRYEPETGRAGVPKAAILGFGCLTSLPFGLAFRQQPFAAGPVDEQQLPRLQPQEQIQFLADQGSGRIGLDPAVIVSGQSKPWSGGSR